MTPVTITGSFGAADAWLRHTTIALVPGTATAVVEVLDRVLQQLVPVTPVVSGRMQASYTLAAGMNIWQLLATAESPKGYPYPGRVVFEPGFSRQYGALTQVLGAAEGELSARVDAVLRRIIGG